MCRILSSCDVYSCQHVRRMGVVSHGTCHRTSDEVLALVGLDDHGNVRMEFLLDDILRYFRLCDYVLPAAHYHVDGGRFLVGAHVA